MYPLSTSHPGPVLLFSAALTSVGVPHAFSTRVGGVSQGEGGCFRSLNFGNPSELPPQRRDPPSNIRANWDLLKGALEGHCPGARERQIVEVHQVHGRDVRLVPQLATCEDLEACRHFKADAIVTDHPHALAAVRVADCAPVLIASRDGRVVSAVHAGWRGTVANIVGAAIAEMKRVRPESCSRGLVAAVGPCIGADAFEVGPEVAAEFERAIPEPRTLVRAADKPGKYLVDLKRALSVQLELAGVQTIDVIPGCTYSSPAWFFSHRRDQTRSGRMVGAIGPRVD